jgi:membrane fusion protein, adhesin transport system
MMSQSGTITANGIATAISRESRPTTQIDSDVDYARVTDGVRNLLVSVVVLVAALVALSLFVKVDEVVGARGDFAPVQHVQVIQTPEGGALSHIFVRDDDRVRAGQIIARFRATDLMRDMAQTESKEAQLQIEIERLGAFAENRSLNLDRYQAKHPAEVDAAMALNKEQVLGLKRDVDQKGEQIAEVKASLDGAEQKIPAAIASMHAADMVRDRVHQGVQMGVVASNRQATVDEQAAEAERTYISLVSSLDEFKARIQAIQAERDALVAKAVSDARSQLAQHIEELQQVEEQLKAYSALSEDIEVKAPVNGIVRNVSETSVGTVIAAGGTVCEIVPTDGGILMDTRVSARDIGFVHVGQKAIVRADAFDYTRFGSVEGRVVRISPDSKADRPGQEPYFVAEIDLKQGYVGADESHVLTPGMTGEASILTGKKSVFQYLLKPIYVTLGSALHEH